MPRKQKIELLYTCGDCAHAHTPHEKGADGEFFLLKCPFREFSVFKTQKQCVKNFKHK